MNYNEIVCKVSDSLRLPKSLVDKTYKAYWKVIREHIVSLPLKEDLTDEDFLKLQPNINIPSIGKLHVTLSRYKRIKKQNEIIKNILENKKSNVEDKKA